MKRHRSVRAGGTGPATSRDRLSSLARSLRKPAVRVSRSDVYADADRYPTQSVSQMLELLGGRLLVRAPPAAPPPPRSLRPDGKALVERASMELQQVQRRSLSYIAPDHSPTDRPPSLRQKRKQHRG
jgi:hypothetical protein